MPLAVLYFAAGLSDDGRMAYYDVLEQEVEGMDEAIHVAAAFVHEPNFLGHTLVRDPKSRDDDTAVRCLAGCL